MNLHSDDLLLIFNIQKYSFLTINQSVKALNNGRGYQGIARRLRAISERGYLSFFGHTKVGFANVPKVYHITRKGYHVLEENFFYEQIGDFRQKSPPKWTAKTQHRLALVDVLIALDNSLTRFDHLDLVKVATEYRYIKSGKFPRAETTDYISEDHTKENKIVPDGAFILHSRRTDARILFFIEIDMGTENITSRVATSSNFPLLLKFKKYDHYLANKTYSQKYQQFGRFDYFIMLFITTTPKRIANVKKALPRLPEKLNKHYRFNTFSEVANNFLNESWQTRQSDDPRGYKLF